MNLRSSFDLGQNVYLIIQDRVTEPLICDLCHSEPLLLADGREIKCPQCGGYPGVKYLGREWRIDGMLAIGQIRFEVTTSDFKEQYMCYETGVGSGTVYNVGDLFATENEARIECAGRNKENAD